MTSIEQVIFSNVVFAAALALVVFLVTRLWRNPHVAHLLWILVLAKCVTPPLWNVPLRVARPTIANAQPSSVMAGESPTVLSSSVLYWQSKAPATQSASLFARPTVVILVGLLWLGSSLLCVASVLTRAMRFHRMAQCGSKVDGCFMQRVKHLADRMGVRRVPDVRLLSIPISPMIWPLTQRRMLLLPERLVAELTPSQLDTVIAHELAHLARRDELVRFLEVVVTCLFWWNPVVWFARRELHAAEEACCDGLVVCLLRESRREYGEALLWSAEMVTSGRSLPALASTFGERHVLKRRIEMILNHDLHRSASWRAKTSIVILSVFVLPLAATATSQRESIVDNSEAAIRPNAAQSKQAGNHFQTQTSDHDHHKAWKKHVWLLEVHGDGQLIEQSCSSCHASDLDPITREFLLSADKLTPPRAPHEQQRHRNRPRWLIEIHGDGQLNNHSCNACHHVSPKIDDLFLFDLDKAL